MAANRYNNEKPVSPSAELHADTLGRSNYDLNSDANQVDLTRPRQTQTDKLRFLFPNLPEDQLSGVADTLHGYCATVWGIYERLQRERPEIIDELMRNRRMKGKVDSSN